ncbi:sensor histidine kinase [Actinocrispum sp. NPDC049592]|uniref:sensor histidine kinase n=1 Tax=Actinocrispum sp. NPDC049592 TaxID=3154835 RepID=UPI003421962D
MSLRTHPVLTVGPYLLLAALTVITAAVDGPRGLWLCALLAAWILGAFTLYEAPPEVFVTGVVVLNMALVIKYPWFGCFTPAGYLYAFHLLPWPRELAGVAAVAVVAGTAQATGVDKSTLLGILAYGGVLAANVLPMCAFGWSAKRSADTTRRLQESLAANAVLDERQRMAREIHDTLAQGLTGIITQLEAASHTTSKDEWQRHVDLATGLARESLTEARRSVDALRPEPLETAQLSAALDTVASRWSAVHGIPVQVTTTGSVRPLSSSAETALLRTAQEALANVAKHAKATRVGVTLSFMDRSVVLDVRDDGSGFDPGVRSVGFGLESMRQRVEELAGTLQVESSPGSGTAISASVVA